MILIFPLIKPANKTNQQTKIKRTASERSFSKLYAITDSITIFFNESDFLRAQLNPDLT